MTSVAILFSLALKGQRSTFRGIVEYAAEHGPWFCHFQEGRTGARMLDFARTGVSGVIVSGVSRADAPEIAALGVPVVFVEPWDEMLAPDFPIRGAPYVRRDSRAIGAMAARYYLERGYESFAFVGEPRRYPWSEARRRGFEETLAAAGLGCAAYDRFTARDRTDWPGERNRLVAFLRGLPRPTAVFAPMDARARLVLEACAVAGLRVPEEIAVLGVDNDPLLCESTAPTLSSIHTGGFRRGWIAAEMLDALLHGREPRERAVSLPPLSVVTRSSTGYAAMTDPSISRAVSYIRRHARGGGIGVGDIVRAAGCSRRYLELRFRSRLGRSIRDELLGERLEWVKTLLSSTNLPIGEVTRRAGFARESHLGLLFRKATGATMRQWRRENHETPEE
ncbi:MAG: substrate-binding domain-containing protein [Kiritimatiellae bacterium]|nr:substrate-binding domain-containing protein [Kiritimatiellia bacterium]